MTAGRVSSVGNGNDYVADDRQSDHSATGSFVRKVSGVLNEADGGQANRYSLQLNTNFFYNTPACNSAPTRQLPGLGTVRLFQRGHCVHPVLADQLCNHLSLRLEHPNGNDCWKNAPEGAAYGPEPITILSLEQVTGHANGRVPTRSRYRALAALPPPPTATAFCRSPTTGTMRNSTLSAIAAAARQTSTAALRLKSARIVYSGTSSAPGCAIAGTTGETNNTNLVAPCTTIKGSTPGLIFSESNPPGSIWVYTGTPATAHRARAGRSWTTTTKACASPPPARTHLYQLWNNGRSTNIPARPAQHVLSRLEASITIPTRLKSSPAATIFISSRMTASSGNTSAAPNGDCWTTTRPSPRWSRPPAGSSSCTTTAPSGNSPAPLHQQQRHRLPGLAAAGQQFRDRRTHHGPLQSLRNAQ
jgi:hypothetical protein